MGRGDKCCWKGFEKRALEVKDPADPAGAACGKSRGDCIGVYIDRDIRLFEPDPEVNFEVSISLENGGGD